MTTRSTEAQPSTTIPSGQQDLFDIPDAVTYLNCANMSPQLRAVTHL
jgi:hypothetical protein